MSDRLSTTNQEYLKEQLGYNHLDHLPPPNTLVVHQMQHALITAAVRRYAAQHEVHMLDVGCGWGDFSEKLDPYLKSYIGIEPSLSELQQFKRQSNRSLIRGVGEHADFIRDQSRNFILLNSVLDHCFDWQGAFVQCLRILAPGGLLIVSMENSRKLPVRIRQWLGRETVHEGHLSFWSVAELERLLAPHFEIQEKQTIGFLFGFHQLTQKVPLPLGLLRVANRAANAIFKVFDPNGGHILFFSAIRRGDPADNVRFQDPFCCPSCKADIEFGKPACSKCGQAMRYANGAILDAIEMNQTLKAQLGMK